MATYSNAPALEIVSYTNSVNNPGDNYQSTEFELVTVPDNTTYQILNCLVLVIVVGQGFNVMVS